MGLLRNEPARGVPTHGFWFWAGRAKAMFSLAAKRDYTR
jgi:hypothetical protein